MKKILCLIPARGGSRGIPRKNIRLLAGKPLIAYAIETALASRNINRVIVSTDDRKIAHVALKHGAEVPFIRPKKLAQDFTPDILVFQHVLKWLKTNESYCPDLIVQLRPTCPLRKAKVVDEAIRMMLRHPEADSLRSVCLAKQTPYKMWRLKGRYLKTLLRIKGVKEPYNLPRQLLPKFFWQNGYVDIVRPRVILKNNMMNGRKILAFVIKDLMIDIDYEESLREAERMLAQGNWFKLVKNQERHSS